MLHLHVTPQKEANLHYFLKNIFCEGYNYIQIEMTILLSGTHARIQRLGTIVTCQRFQHRPKVVKRPLEQSNLTPLPSWQNQKAHQCSAL